MNPHELKALQGQLAKARADETAKHEELKTAAKEYRAAQQRANQLQKQINAAIEAAKEPIVSEHALLRYLERVHNIDLEALKAMILTPQLSNAIKTLGSGKYPLSGGGGKAVVKDKVIVSITD